MSPKTSFRNEITFLYEIFPVKNIIVKLPFFFEDKPGEAIIYNAR